MFGFLRVKRYTSVKASWLNTGSEFKRRFYLTLIKLFFSCKLIILTLGLSATLFLNSNETLYTISFG